jgi:hypothetical protein
MYIVSIHSCTREADNDQLLHLPYILLSAPGEWMNEYLVGFWRHTEHRFFLFWVWKNKINKGVFCWYICLFSGKKNAKFLKIDWKTFHHIWTLILVHQYFLIPFFPEKTYQILKNALENFSPHLDSDFSLAVFFNPFFS